LTVSARAILITCLHNVGQAVSVEVGNMPPGYYKWSSVSVRCGISLILKIGLGECRQGHKSSRRSDEPTTTQKTSLTTQGKNIR
jgi:hypothetical protein